MPRFRGRIGALLAIAAVGGLLAGCSSVPATPAQKVRSWSNQAGLSSIDDQLNADLTYFTHAIGHSSLQALQTNCDGFPADVEALYETLPSPDVSITNRFNNAAQDWFAAAHDCVTASKQTDKYYKLFVSNFKKGSVAYNNGKKRLKTFNVR